MTISNLAKLTNNNLTDTKSTMYDDAKSALAFYSKMRFLIPSVIIILISFMFIIYGIKLLFADDSNIKSSKVSITKIINSNNLTQTCQDKVLKTTTYNRKQSEVSEKTVYNCIIYFNLFGKERMKQINDSNKNYIIGQEIIIWYDEDNIDNELLLYYNSLIPYRYLFILGGIVIIALIILANYALFNNDRLAMGLGVFDIASSLLNRD
jgi:hypothetical protein